MSLKKLLLTVLILQSMPAFAQDPNPFQTSVYKFNYKLTRETMSMLNNVFLGTTKESQKALSDYFTLQTPSDNTYVFRHESIYLIQVCGIREIAGVTTKQEYKSIQVPIDESLKGEELIAAMKDAGTIVAEDIGDVPDRYQDFNCRGALMETGTGAGEYRQVVISYQDVDNGYQSIPLTLIYPPISE